MVSLIKFSDGFDLFATNYARTISNKTDNGFAVMCDCFVILATEKIFIQFHVGFDAMLGFNDNRIKVIVFSVIFAGYFIRCAEITIFGFQQCVECITPCFHARFIF